MRITKTELNRLTQIAEGGEGIIYEYHGDILKIYKQNVDIAAKERKVNTLLSSSLPNSVITPKESAYDENNRFIGYVMPKIIGEEIRVLTSNKYLKANKIKTDFILQLLVNIHKTLIDLHKSGIYIGDLNDQNILFDHVGHVYFIDTDSWSIGSDSCEVVMDLFRDPLMHGVNFTAETDNYAFSILTWKLLTRIHPFGGTMNPDVNILERMKRGLCVINNTSVKIPRTIKSWNNLSPTLIHTLDDIFTNKSRILGDELEDMCNNLKFCKKDDEFYYGKFDKCPLCDSNATVRVKPISQGIVNGLSLIKLLAADDVDIVLNENSYLDVNGNVVNLRKMQRYPYSAGYFVYFLVSGIRVNVDKDCFMFTTDRPYSIDIKPSTSVYVDSDEIYYITPSGMFTKMTVTEKGNGIKSICKCSHRVYYAVFEGVYCIINQYDYSLIINCNGKNFEVEYVDKIVNYGINYDYVTGRWLIIIENSKGEYLTYIFGDTVEFNNNQISYKGRLGNVCLSNNIIYIPIDGKIRGYSPIKQVFKDFECDAVTPDSKLIKIGKQFTIVNDENIYVLGK